MAIFTGERINTDLIRIEQISYLVDQPLNENWYYTESIPEVPIAPLGKYAELQYNTTSNEFVFELRDRPLTELEEKEVEIDRLNALLQDALDLLIEMEVL